MWDGSPQTNVFFFVCLFPSLREMALKGISLRLLSWPYESPLISSTTVKFDHTEPCAGPLAPCLSCLLLSEVLRHEPLSQGRPGRAHAKEEGNIIASPQRGLLNLNQSTF